MPLLKATQQYSFNDEKRQKLSQSPLSRRNVSRSCLEQDWKAGFYRMLHDGMERVLKSQRQYQAMDPADVDHHVSGGINTLTQPLEREHDILLTSPPYMQAQEYIRRFKMDLLWMGWSEDLVRDLGRMEMPYQRVDEVPIHSPTYEEYLEKIQEPHLKLLYQRYFWGVFGALTRLQESIRRHLLLFVGPASVRGMPIPISRDRRRTLLPYRLASQDHPRRQHRLPRHVLLPRQPRHRRSRPPHDHRTPSGAGAVT